MAHCDDAESAQQVISRHRGVRDQLDYDLDGAVMRLADRNAYAAAGTRSNSPRGALAFKFAAEEKTTVLADVLWDVGKTGKVAPVAALEPGVRGRHDGHPRDARQPGGHPRPRHQDRRHGARPPRRRRDPVRRGRAGRVQAHRRRAGDRPADRVPLVRRAADRAGQQPRAVLHQRRLPRPDRAAADPLGARARRRTSRRSARSGSRSSPPRATSSTRPTSTRSRASGCWSSTASATSRRTAWSSRSRPRATSGCGAR